MPQLCTNWWSGGEKKCIKLALHRAYWLIHVFMAQIVSTRVWPMEIPIWPKLMVRHSEWCTKLALHRAYWWIHVSFLLLHIAVVLGARFVIQITESLRTHHSYSNQGGSEISARGMCRYQDHKWWKWPVQWPFLSSQCRIRAMTKLFHIGFFLPHRFQLALLRSVTFIAYIQRTWQASMATKSAFTSKTVVRTK